MSVRQFLVITHRWMGLIAGVVLLTIGATGCLLLLPIPSRVVSRIHTMLLVGAPGRWIVNAVTLVSILLVLSGVILWFRRRVFRIVGGKGWRRLLHDLHHAGGVVGAVVMLVLAASGLGLLLLSLSPPPLRPDGTREPLSEGKRRTRRVVSALHTGKPFSLPVKAIYFAGSALFVLQGVSGFTMWWKRREET